MRALLEGLGWVEELTAWDENGVLCVCVGHSYPPGVNISGPVRVILRQWIPVAIPIELAIRVVPPLRNTTTQAHPDALAHHCICMSRALH